MVPGPLQLNYQYSGQELGQSGGGEAGKNWAVWEFHVMGCTYVGIGTLVRLELEFILGD